MSLMVFTVKEPKSDKDFEMYYLLRWKILRKPLGKHKGSEKDLLEKKSYHLMITDELKNIVAVGRIHLLNKKDIISAQIRYMAVENKYIKCGLGTMILDKLEEYAGSNDVSQIILNTRESSIGFYEKNGYNMVKKAHTLYNSVKHWKMKKKIGP